MLKLEEYYKIGEEYRKLQQQNDVAKSETANNSSQDNFHGDCDSIYTLENGSATVLYLVSMLGGGIFNDRWLIWVVATFIYIRFITRHLK